MRGAPFASLTCQRLAHVVGDIRILSHAIGQYLHAIAAAALKMVKIRRIFS
jgi:hypothetical protein